MVSLFPKIMQDEDDELVTEMIFVVDRSGSMGNMVTSPQYDVRGNIIESSRVTRLDKVRECMKIFLKSLSEGTMFNIVGFGSRMEMLFPEGSREYDEDSMNVALQHVEDMRANLGGTNIKKPLNKIFSEPATPGVPRQVRAAGCVCGGGGGCGRVGCCLEIVSFIFVLKARFAPFPFNRFVQLRAPAPPPKKNGQIFLLTDGQVRNAPECIATVADNAQTTRVFTFGIGKDSDRELCMGMAKAGGGKGEIVDDNANINAVVIDQLESALKVRTFASGW